MKWVKDLTGRFTLRPHYQNGELDYMCEQVVHEFLMSKYGKCEFPISTDDIQVMIERDVSNLDVYADLSGEGGGVEGLTNFFKDKAPEVKVSQMLSSEEYKHNRFRTTLTHEYGHVKLHAFLWSMAKGSSFSSMSNQNGPRCKRDNIVGAPATDWMEWQAGYACGAMLMPITHVKGLVHSAFREWGIFGGISPSSEHFTELLTRISTAFTVSKDAARVRLYKLEFVGNESQNPTLSLGI